jgi:hypothetical protein
MHCNSLAPRKPQFAGQWVSKNFMKQRFPKVSDYEEEEAFLHGCSDFVFFRSQQQGTFCLIQSLHMVVLRNVGQTHPRALLFWERIFSIWEKVPAVALRWP